MLAGQKELEHVAVWAIRKPREQYHKIRNKVVHSYLG
jgi:hypothetical protein